VRRSSKRVAAVRTAVWRTIASVRGPAALRGLTLAHVLGIVAGGWVTVTLANSLFFDLSPQASRIEVMRYLAITMLPIAVLAGVVGPLLDRLVRGPRWFAVCSNLARAVCCIGLAATVHTLAFFVWAFALLIANKGFTASKYALLPTLVERPENLVSANVFLAKWGAASGAIGVAIGATLNHLVGARSLLLLAALVFVFASLAMRDVAAHAASRATVAPLAAQRTPARPARRARVAALPFIATRCGVGFFSFTCAFALRRAGESAALLGTIGACYAIGSLLGNVLAPASRRRTSEERMIAVTVLAATIACAFAALTPISGPVFVAAFTLGFAAAHARQGFDSIVQSTSTAHERGRVFALFETQSQLAWVAGALLATFATIELRPASLLLASLFTFALFGAREIFGRAVVTGYHGPPVLRPVAFTRPAAARLRNVRVSD